jgi:hypothetical protein
MPTSALLFVAAFLLGTGATGLGQAGPTLKNVTVFDLTGAAGKRFDYLTIDEDDHYLISAHLAAERTYVIDLRNNRTVAVVTDTPGVEGVEYVPELKKFYTSNAHDDTIGVVDLKKMKVIRKLKTASKPDGSTYAAPFHKLYVSDERGKAVAIVNVQSDEIGARYVSTAKPGCRNMILLHARCTSTCKTRISLRSSIPRRTRWRADIRSGTAKVITEWRWTPVTVRSLHVRRTT